jgi:hypothetical protein
MMSKTSIAILAAATIFGAASAGQASGSKNDASSRGGSDIGPLGQCFMPPDCDPGRDQQGGPYAYARPAYGYARGIYAYARPYPRGWHYTPDYGWHYGRP